MYICFVYIEYSKWVNGMYQYILIDDKILLTCKICTDEFLSSALTYTSNKTDSLNSRLKCPNKYSILNDGGFQTASVTGQPPNFFNIFRNGISPVFLICAKKLKYQQRKKLPNHCGITQKYIFTHANPCSF